MVELEGLGWVVGTLEDDLQRRVQVLGFWCLVFRVWGFRVWGFRQLRPLRRLEFRPGEDFGFLGSWAESFRLRAVGFKLCVQV